MRLQYVGADPELCVRDKATSRFISALGIIPGTKNCPLPVRNGAVQRDGMLAEFNIDPADTVNKFIDNIKDVMSQLKEIAGDSVELTIEPYADYDDDVWNNTPAEAKQLGCDPDYDAYTGEVNNPPDNRTQGRSAAGHVHLGWTQDQDLSSPAHLFACRAIAKELDLTMAYPLQLLDESEGSIRRRKLYGRPGAFRPKPYGMEYRVPSNFWLGSEELMAWVYETCHNTFQNLIDGNGKNQGDSPLMVISDCLLGVRKGDAMYRSCLNSGVIKGGLRL